MKKEERVTSSATNFKPMSSFYDMQPENELINAQIPRPIWSIGILGSIGHMYNTWYLYSIITVHYVADFHHFIVYKHLVVTAY